MSNHFKMDLSKFKHVSTDEHQTVLQHYEGHQITLNHKKLNKEAKAKLKDMADKKAAKDDKSSDAPVKTDSKAASEERVKMAKGGTAHHPASEFAPRTKAEEGNDTAAANRAVVNPAAPKTHKTGYQVAPSLQPQHESPKKSDIPDDAIPMAEGGSVPGFQMPDSDISSIANGYTQEVPPEVAQGAGGPISYLDQVGANLTNPIARASASQVSAMDGRPNALSQAPGMPVAGEPQGLAPAVDGAPDQVAPQPQSTGLAGAMPMGDNGDGFGTQIAGINAAAKAQGALGEANAKILADQQAAVKESQAAYQKNYAALDERRQALESDIQNGKVDPDKFWTGDPKTGEGGHSKLLAGIGMIIAGFNPTSAPNAAINYLKFQMEQNLRSQEKNLSAKENLLSQNLRQFGNLKDAQDMTRIQQADMVTNMLQQAAAKAQGPMAQAAAMQAIGPLQREANMYKFQMAIRRSMMEFGQKGTGGNPADTRAAEQLATQMAQVDPAKAKELRERIVPGVGVASQPIPDDVRKQLIMRQDFNHKLEEYANFAKKHAGTVLDRSVVNQGKAMAAELSGAYRAATNGGVFKEGEQNFIESVIPSDPTQFAGSFRTLPKINEVVASNRASYDTVKRAYGLSVAPQPQSTGGGSSREAAMQWLKANPNSPKAAAVKKALGI